MDQSVVLPNNMRIFALNEREASFLYQELFIDNCYFQFPVVLKPGDRIIDVGANIGLFAIQANSFCSDLEILTFEPLPEVYEILNKNMEAHGINAKTFCYGVSDKNHTAMFTYFPDYSIMSGEFANAQVGRSVLEEHATKCFIDDFGRPPETAKKLASAALGTLLQKPLHIQVPVFTLSHIFSYEHIDAVSLLKIDTEGSELTILNGIAESDWKKIDQILIETHDLDSPVTKQVELLLHAKQYRIEKHQTVHSEVMKTWIVFATRLNIK